MGISNQTPKLQQQ